MSSLTIKTAKLQSMLNKAVKCAGNNKINVLTSLVHVKLLSGVLSITTTDVNNYLTILEKDISGDDLEFTVQVDTLSKLISKTSVEDVRISISNDMISITGNGTYKIPIQLDVDGSPIKYPKFTINAPDESGKIKIAFIKNIISHNKSSLAITDERPYLKGYYFVGDNVISADAFNICSNNIKLFDKNILVSPTVLDLLSICTDDEVSYALSEDSILFESDTIRLFSHLMPNAEEYDPFVGVIENFVNTEHKSSCVLPKTALLNIIDRLSLFIKDNDQNAVNMTFTKNDVKIENIDGSGIESVPYQGSNNFSDYSCCIGVDSLKRQLSSISGESVNIFYGDDTILTIKQDGATHVISLLHD